MRSEVLTRHPTFREDTRLKILRMQNEFHTHELAHRNITIAGFLLILLGMSSGLPVMKSLGGAMALAMEAILLVELILQGILFVFEVFEEPLFK